jgi:hypothetical protein
MASLIRLYNNHLIRVLNNRNNSSRTTLIGDQITLLKSNNNSGPILIRGQVNPLENNNTNP